MPSRKLFWCIIISVMFLLIFAGAVGGAPARGGEAGSRAVSVPHAPRISGLSAFVAAGVAARSIALPAAPATP